MEKRVSVKNKRVMAAAVVVDSHGCSTDDVFSAEDAESHLPNCLSKFQTS